MACAVCAALPGLAQTAHVSTESDTTATLLEDVVIVTGRRLPALRQGKSGGSFRLGAEAMSDMPLFLGNADPLRVMQSLPAVSSGDLVSGGIYVQGSESAHNRVSIDDVEIYNPMHFLGLFSVFNTPHFSTFDIDPNPQSSLLPNFVGADISANTSWHTPRRFSGNASAGLIDAHATVRIPLKEETASVSLSGRASYIDLLYGNSLKLGNAPLKYGFHDFNVTYLQRISDRLKMKVSGYYGSDHMVTNDPNYSSDIDLGWKNAAAGISLLHSSGGTHTFGYSHFSNDIRIRYTDIDRAMPSSLNAWSYSGNVKAGKFELGAGAVLRNVVPQSASEGDFSLDTRVGAALPLEIGKLRIVPGMKGAFYCSRDFSRFYPLPSVSVSFRFSEGLTMEGAAGMRVQMMHKILESALGLPTDFWLSSGKVNRPLESYDMSFGIRGSMWEGAFNYSAGTFYHRFRNMTDWTGSLFSMLNKGYDPLSDVISGRGEAFGVTGMVHGEVGPIQGWISYTWSKTRQRFPGMSGKWYPSSHDRTHDLNLNLVWRVGGRLTLSASFVFAGGQPYTEPLYGYMVGENLILEFKEHNSSRLPPIHRLDLGADWRFYSRNGMQQGLNLSVFNVYGHDNVLLRSYSYSPDKGIHATSLTMGFVIPSLSYYINF